VATLAPNLGVLADGTQLAMELPNIDTTAGVKILTDVPRTPREHRAPGDVGQPDTRAGSSSPCARTRQRTWASGAVETELGHRELVESAAVRHLYVQSYAHLVRPAARACGRSGLADRRGLALVADADLLRFTVVEAAQHLMEVGCSLDGFVEQAIAAPSRASPRRT
jgi:hypothetical protein